MADHTAIIEAADQLGRLIADHPATKKLKGLLDRLDTDTDAQRRMNDLNRHNQTLAEKQSKGQPIEVEDKRKMQSLQEAVADDELLRDLQIAQMDYMDLMRKVDERLRAADPIAAS